MDSHSDNTHVGAFLFLFKIQPTTSDPSSKRLTGSALEIEMLQLGKADMKVLTRFFF